MRERNSDWPGKDGFLYVRKSRRECQPATTADDPAEKPHQTLPDSDDFGDSDDFDDYSLKTPKTSPAYIVKNNENMKTLLANAFAVVSLQTVSSIFTSVVWILMPPNCSLLIIKSISENQKNRNDFLFHYSMHKYSSFVACFEHSNFFKVKLQAFQDSRLKPPWDLLHKHR